MDTFAGTYRHWFAPIAIAIVVANGRLKDNTKLRFITGKKTKNTYRRVIDVRERVKAPGSSKSKALIGFHNFTGAD